MIPLDPVVVIGTGEMSGVFTRGLLKLGHPIIPVTRAMDIDQVAAAHPQPPLVLVTVAEGDLHPLLEMLPKSWRDRLALLQNELLPDDWQRHHISQPTVISVWFEKKPGQDYKVLVPSPIFGRSASLLKSALEGLEIPAWELLSGDQLLFELVRKNLYILTTNIAGLQLPTGATVEQLWGEHQVLAKEVASEVLDIQFRLVDCALDREGLIEAMVTAIEGDLAHQCMGRSAPARLARAIDQAEQFELPVPTLRLIQRQQAQ